VTSGRQFANLWDEFLSEGRVTTTQAEIRDRTGSSVGSVRIAVAEAQRRHFLFSPVRGLYVLVPPQYRRQGTVPADWFLDDLCRHLDRNYYLGYLSAAARHGSAHQAPQVTQTVVERRVADRALGPIQLRFYTDVHMSQWAVTSVTGPTGSLRVATAETCALDLAETPERGGGVGNIVTVLGGLTLDAEKLALQAERRPRAAIRRLGLLLEYAAASVALDALVEIAAAERSRTLLDPKGPPHGPFDKRWHVVMNTTVEPDE
jgi:predicted transcriptional regulator of viral defense system